MESQRLGMLQKGLREQQPEQKLEQLEEHRWHLQEAGKMHLLREGSPLRDGK
jgi:hypothetical protein